MPVTDLLQAEAIAPVECTGPAQPWAHDALSEAIHGKLRCMAAARMATERPGLTLQPTALVHEAWLRMGNRAFPDEARFLAAASETMRRILVDQARHRRCAKNRHEVEFQDKTSLDVAAPVPSEEILAVHEALDGLAALDSRKAELVKLRYFVGLSFEEAAALLGISLSTAKRDWAYSRAWLHHAIHHPD